MFYRQPDVKDMTRKPAYRRAVAKARARLDARVESAIARAEALPKRELNWKGEPILENPYANRNPYENQANLHQLHLDW